MCVHKRIAFGTGMLTDDTVVSVRRLICIVEVEPYVILVTFELLAFTI